LKFYKDPEGKIEAHTFAPRDKVYIRTFVSNVPKDGLTLRWRIFSQGEKDAPPELEKYIYVPSDDTVTFTLTPNPGGMTPGKFRVEVNMLLTAVAKANGTYAVEQ
jgi:hypothetical protein